MADCLAQLWTDPTNYGWCAVSADGAVIVGKAPDNTFWTLSTADYTTITQIMDRSAVAFVGDPAIAADNKIYWLETPDFSNYRLMRANIDGTSITTIQSPISFSPSMSFSFEIPNLAYDPGNDIFWLGTFTGPRLRTLTKAGVATSIMTPASSSLNFHNPVIDSMGGVWVRWSTATLYRTDSVTHTTVTTSDLFGDAFPAVSLDLGGNGIVENGGPDSFFSFNGSAIVTTTPSPCTIVAHAFGFTPSFWTPDYSAIYYAEPGSSSPVVNAYLWGGFVTTGVPPLRIYGRNDDLATGAPIIPPFRSTWQNSGRLRQAAGHA